VRTGRLLLEREVAFEKAFVEVGFTPLETISPATSTGAKFLGIDDRAGTVANVTLIFRDGVAWSPQALIERVRGTVGR
jgi:hypothetical protein